VQAVEQGLDVDVGRWRDELLDDLQQDLLLATGALEVVGGVAASDIVLRRLAVEQLPPGGQVQVQVRVDQRLLDADANAADRLDHVGQVAHVDLDVVVDVDLQQLTDRAHHPLSTLLRVDGVHLLLPGRAVGQWNVDRVTRQADQRHL
jgi:hypothetical protein